MDVVAMILGFVLGGLIIGILVLLSKPRLAGDPLSLVKQAVQTLSDNNWSLLIRPVDGKNIFGVITDRWKKEHNISGRMRDRGHVVSLTTDDEWDEWLDYYNPMSGDIDELVAADGTAVMSMALTRNLDDSLKDIKWFIPRSYAGSLKQRADYSSALEGRLHNSERDLEDVDNMRRMFHRDRKKLQVQNRALNTESDMLNKQINELLIINSSFEREAIELRSWKEFGQRVLLAEKKGLKNGAEFLTTSLQDASAEHLLKSAELYDKVQTKMPPVQMQTEAQPPPEVELEKPTELKKKSTTSPQQVKNLS